MSSVTAAIVTAAIVTAAIVTAAMRRAGAAGQYRPALMVKPDFHDAAFRLGSLRTQLE